MEQEGMWTAGDAGLGIAAAVALVSGLEIERLGHVFRHLGSGLLTGSHNLDGGAHSVEVTNVVFGRTKILCE